MAYTNTAQKGREFILAKGATAIGGFRTKSASLNAETVDTTNADNTNRWRELLAAAGVKSMSISGAGVIKDTAAQQALFTGLINQTSDTYTITIPGVGTFTGAFQVASLQASGEHNAEGTFEVTLESAGDITFTAEA